VKDVTAADLGGAAYDSQGDIQGRANWVWTVVAVNPNGRKVYLSLHTTKAGAEARLAKKARKWGVDIDHAGEVNQVEIESP